MNTALLLAPVAIPAAASCAYLLLGWRRRTAHLGTFSAALVLAVGIALAVRTVDDGGVFAASGWLRADPLAAFLLTVIGAVAFVACAASPGYLAADHGDDHAGPASERRYAVLVQAFLAAMALAVVAGNLGLVWVAIEATTTVTAFLVGHKRSRAAVEAAWKYVVVCSVGIALALLGIVVLYAAARHAGLSESAALNFDELAGHAHSLDRQATRMAVALIVLGFGAKAGLAPLHSWLPDAHSQAPAPVSALMSGVLLSVSFSVILRTKQIADAALGAGFVRTLLLIVALATLAVAALLLIGQRDYKRMLAYSSMEHMGLIALGAAVGTPLALTAVLLHIVGHGLGKAAAFCASGQILHEAGTSRIDDVRGLAARTPVLAGTFGAAVLVLLGFPPFSLFASELGIARAGFAAGLGWLTAAGFVLILLAFAAIAAHTGRMLLGADPLQSSPTGSGPAALRRQAPLIAALAVVAFIGVAAWPLSTLLNAAAPLAGR
ncbi:proton-conducting transporter membrane subunit [Catenulispora subtropica]|uniref:Proton-conducting transporter membrane subunit n=1 Tax=Catenulispora subtropica TaxID=450798 RepID=A0ABN2R8M6_9ACTN